MRNRGGLGPRVAAVIAALVTCPPEASAQDATGHMEGRVVTADALPAPSVRVTATSPNLQLAREIQTDVRGYFRLQHLPVGTYEVRLASMGKRPVLIQGVAVRLGRTTPLGTVTLEPLVFELGEIVVNGVRPLVDVASASTGTNLTSEQFSAVPTGRNFRSIVPLAPQANESQFPGEESNISGGTGFENAYYLDGVNITAPRFAETSADLPYNFVREIQIKTGGYEAEFGRATGGIVDVVTHTGSNRFGGQVDGFFTGSGLTADPRFTSDQARESDYSEYDVGGSLGGPIVRDRLWFFAAYNPTFLRQHVDIPGLDDPEQRSTRHLFASKLTWLAGPNTDVVVTAHKGDADRMAPRVPRCRPVPPERPLSRSGDAVLPRQRRRAVRDGLSDRSVRPRRPGRPGSLDPQQRLHSGARRRCRPVRLAR